MVKIYHMIVNPRKFWEIIFDKCKGSHDNPITNIDQKEIKTVWKVLFLEIKIDDKLKSQSLCYQYL